MSHWFLERLRSFGANEAFVWKDESYSYDELFIAIGRWQQRLAADGVRPGDVVAIDGDYSPETCALLLAMIANENVVVPLSSVTGAKKDEFLAIAEVGSAYVFDARNAARHVRFDREATHPLVAQLRGRGAPGLILFSSGTTGRSKASLLDFNLLLAKYREVKRAQRTLVFLMLDHIGGINTMMHVLSQGGTLITVARRDPSVVFEAVERHRVQVLPTTPTFLNMTLISGALDRYDTASLELITYGTEPMPLNTLRKLGERLPAVRLKQTYGLSELGILPTRSKSSDALWVKLGTDGFQHKIVDNVLWVKSDMAMLGYLNAPSPFDESGWFNTQDVVEVDGDYVRILGRKSDIINVGGEKVYPSEVESVLLQMENVSDVMVVGKRSPITGMVVHASVRLSEPESLASVKQRIAQFCATRLERFKIPMSVDIARDELHTERFKKTRALAS